VPSDFKIGYVVANNSLWLLFCPEQFGSQFTLQKIRIKKDTSSPIEVGTKLIGGNRLAITPAGLVVYESERRLPLSELPSAKFYGKTGWVVGLFLNNIEAHNCLDSPGIELCDPRWRRQTNQVLRVIGNDHPSIIPSTWSGISFPPSDP